ncbi:putative glutathione S-transferase parA [Carex rostrata]
MASQKGVMLLDFWASPFGQRVRIALAEKGVEYEHKEENLSSKSELLIKSNQVHKNIPVLIHDCKTVFESLTIVQYIDEVWSDKTPLMPSDPYQRAQARFWADYVDKKVYDCTSRLWKPKEEEKEAAKMEMIEILQLLEVQLGDNKYFGGDTFGLVDVAFVPFTSWFYMFEMIAKLNVEAVAPRIVAWAKRCQERESVAKALSDPKTVYEFICMVMKKVLGQE